jgi:hypothetical protein
MNDLPDDLYGIAFELFVAYEKRVDPDDPTIEFMIAAWMQNASYRIRMKQIMFALAYQEFGNGNQEAFFRAIAKYNEGALDGLHLGPKKFTSAKSLRDYLKKAQAQIHFGDSRKILRQYNEMVSAAYMRRK